MGEGEGRDLGMKGEFVKNVSPLNIGLRFNSK
jgi:hypothetical protein